MFYITSSDVTCVEVNAPDNGQVTLSDNGGNDNSRAEFTCDTSYYLEGDATLDCTGTTSTGTWGTVPTCAGK